ncbi:hypothetical protein SAMN05443661_11513 [Natronobacterium gregoryi]|uniref:Uncharacterized protein n=2 Tax=Natronobacterium gregoryi TaxID=44930 RepID=L0AEU2_NATGS|nr:hypothetical protein Natgr_0709 [Natronobacterium gregoryi SP2]ELY62549.1 hypothetical protein C490_17716 [Natronobacterium gregoryi SP2]SFJ12917.1 hypothetical protein SAMN05443661_11513 [Natronobacterium gregoryi]
MITTEYVYEAPIRHGTDREISEETVLDVFEADNVEVDHERGDHTDARRSGEYE